MISSIQIKNFQSHKDSKLEFVAPGVNVIVGSSRHGKTSILRAFRKVLENRPIVGIDGWLHKHKKENQISIQINTTDGHTISWYGPEQQKYVIDGQEFKGFGQSVPDLVTDVINMNDLNIQHQHDLPFLVFDPPGQVAKYLNQLIQLESIDKAMSNINSVKRKNEQDTRTQERIISELKEYRETFPDLQSVEEFIIGLETLEKERKEKTHRVAQLTTIQQHLAGYKEALFQIKIPINAEKRIEELFQKNSVMEQKKYTKDLLIGIQNSLKELSKKRTSLIPIISNENKVNSLLRKKEMLNGKKSTLGRLKRIQRELLEERGKFSQKNLIIEQKEKELSEIWPDICPLCGQSVS